MDYEKSIWENIYKRLDAKQPKTDGWLDKYMPVINKSADIPVIDLGCGFGNDTFYLKQRGFEVISCDYSKAALERLKHFIENPDCRCFDMREKLPFESGSARVIICDLSLHYFDKKRTEAIISEIDRVLQPGGALLCRVNSIDETGNEESPMIELEKNFYLVGQKKKRYFDKGCVYKFFDRFAVGKICEYEMHRYKKPKCVLDFSAVKQLTETHREEQI